MYYGCDSNSDSFPCGAQFYIGKMGYGTTATPGGSGWNQNAVNYVGYDSVWGYWGVDGPESGNATTDSEAYAWGQQQALAAGVAWAGTDISHPTIFADIESENGGWGTNQSLNQNVYLGFIEQLNAEFNTSGVYSSPGEWSNIMGASFSASPAKCVWSAAWLSGSCNSCPTSITGQGFGGFAPSIWQYNGNTGNGTPCPADLDCAEALPS